MASTKILPTSFSKAKPSQSRQQPISSDFSNWNQLLNNLNEIEKGSKKLSKKIDDKKKIVYKFSSRDTNIKNINNHINEKIKISKERQKNGVDSSIFIPDDDDDSKKKQKQNQRLILELIKKSDIEKNLEFLKKRFKYYRFIQHQEIIEIEASRINNLEYKNSYKVYLRSIGIPLFISLGLTGIVAGINLLFISNIAGIPFWLDLCEKMLDSGISKIIFETTINIMSLFGLFTAAEVLSLRNLYKKMIVETNTIDFKNIGKEKIKTLIKNIFTTSEISKDKTTEHTFAFFSYIKKCIKSKDIESVESKATLTSILNAKDRLFETKKSAGVDFISSAEGVNVKAPADLLSAQTALSFVDFVVKNYNSPLFMWSFNILGICKQTFKFVNISIDKLNSYPNSSDIIIFRDLANGMLSSYSANELILWISNTVSGMPYDIGKKITTSNIDYLLSPFKPIMDNITPLGLKITEYVGPIKEYIGPIKEYVAPITKYFDEYIGPGVSSIKQVINGFKKYLKSYINFTKEEISQEIIETKREEAKLEEDEKDDINTISIFGTKIAEILEKYRIMPNCLLESSENNEQDKLKKCNSDFINYLISIYPTDGKTPPKSLAPKILSDTLTSITEAKDAESIKQEMTKVYNYYSGFFDESDKEDKLSGIKNRLIETKDKIKATISKIYDLEAKKIGKEVEEVQEKIELLQFATPKNEEEKSKQETPPQIKANFKSEFKIEELQEKIDSFQQCFNEQTIEKIKLCYKLLTDYIINSFKTENTSVIGTDFIQTLKQKMIDIDKITDINELKEEGRNILNSINTHFYNSLMELMNELIINKYKIVKRIGKTKEEIEKMDEADLEVEMKQRKRIEKSKNAIISDELRLKFIIGYKEKIEEEKSGLIRKKEREIPVVADELLAILAEELSKKGDQIVQNEDLMKKILSEEEIPFDDFKQLITTEKIKAEDSLRYQTKISEQNSLLSTIYEKYVAQILQLSNNKNINEEQKTELESIIQIIKNYIDKPDKSVDTLDSDISNVYESINKYSDTLNSYITPDLNTGGDILLILESNIKDLSSLFFIKELLIKYDDEKKLYTELSDIIQKGGDKNEILLQIQKNINEIAEKQSELFTRVKEELDLLGELEGENTQQIAFAKRQIEDLKSSSDKITIKYNKINELKNDKAKIIELLKQPTSSGIDEAKKREELLKKDSDIKVLELEIKEIQLSIELFTQKFNKPVIDIDSEIKAIRLQTARIMTTIKDKDSSYIGLLTSNDFIKGLIKTNVNTYLQTNKNVLIDVFFNKYIDQNEDREYKEKIYGQKKTAIMSIEEEILYMSKLSKTKTSKEISQILSASSVTSSKNPFNFKTPFMKYVATLYSRYNEFLNDPTTMLYAVFSTETLQNIFSSSFFYNFFGGVGGLLGTGFTQHAVLKGYFYKEFDLKNIPYVSNLFDILGDNVEDAFPGSVFLDLFSSKQSLRSGLTFLINMFIGNDAVINLKIQTMLNNLIQEIMFDFDILFMELSRIVFNSKSVQSIYRYIEKIMGKWLAGSFKLLAKLTYKLSFLPSITSHLLNKVPNKIDLIQIINDPKQFGSLCQFINHKMFNIIKYAKEFRFGDMFRQFSDLNGTDFYKNVTTFLDTNNYFQSKKYDPRTSISNLNGNIITLRNKVSLNQEEYIIIDNDPDNFKLIPCSEIFDFVEQKFSDSFKDGTFEIKGLKIDRRYDQSSDTEDSGTMEYLFLHYMTLFKKENPDLYTQLNKITNSDEFDSKFKIEFNSFLVRKAALVYNNGNPNLVQYSLVNKLLNLIDKNELLNDKISAKNLLNPEDKKDKNRFFFVATKIIEDQNNDVYIKKFFEIYSKIDINDEVEKTKKTTGEPKKPTDEPKKPTDEPKKKETIKEMIQETSIKELFERQSVGKIVILVPYYDFWLRKISYKKTEVDFRDYLKISQLLLFSMNDENSIQVTRSQLDALEALESKTNNPELVDALKALNERFGTAFTSIKELRLNFENKFFNALQLNYISFTTLGLDNELFIKNLLNYDNEKDLITFDDITIRSLINEINELEIIESGLRKQKKEVVEKTKELTTLINEKTTLESKLKIEPKSDIDVQRLPILEDEIVKLTAKIASLKTLVSPTIDDDILRKSQEINSKKIILTDKKINYIRGQIFPISEKSGKPPEKGTIEYDTKQYICFITNKIDKITTKCDTSISELIKLLLQPQSLLTLKDNEHKKNLQLASNEESYNLGRQYESSVRMKETMIKITRDYESIVESIDKQMTNLQDFLNEKIVVTCPKIKTLTRGAFLDEQSLLPEYINLSFNDTDKITCNDFTIQFGFLREKLDSLDSKFKDLDTQVIKAVNSIDSTKLNDKDKKIFEEFKEKLSTRGFRDLEEIKSLISSYRQGEKEDSIKEITGQYLSFLYEISIYYKKTNNQHSQSDASMFGQSDILSVEKHPLNYNLKPKKYEGVDEVLYNVQKFFVDLYDGDKSYMSTKIKSQKLMFEKSLLDEKEQFEKIKEARKQLYIKLSDKFHILNSDVGSDENKKILWSIIFTINEMSLKDTSNPILNNFKDFIQNILENSNANENSYSQLYNYLSGNIDENKDTGSLLENFEKTNVDIDKEYYALRDTFCTTNEAGEQTNTQEQIKAVQAYIKKKSYGNAIMIIVDQKMPGTDEKVPTPVYFHYDKLRNSIHTPEFMELINEAMVIEEHLKQITDSIKNSKPFTSEQIADPVFMRDSTSACSLIKFVTLGENGKTRIQDGYYEYQKKLVEVQKRILQNYSKSLFSEQIDDVNDRYMYFVDESFNLFLKFSLDVNNVYKKFIQNYKPEPPSAVLPILPSKSYNFETTDETHEELDTSVTNKLPPPPFAQPFKQSSSTQTTTKVSNPTTTKVIDTKKDVETLKNLQGQKEKLQQEELNMRLENGEKEELKNRNAEALGGGDDTSGFIASILNGIKSLFKTPEDVEKLDQIKVPQVKEDLDSRNKTVDPESLSAICMRVHGKWWYENDKLRHNPDISIEEAELCSKENLTQKLAVKVDSAIVSFLKGLVTVIQLIVAIICWPLSTPGTFPGKIFLVWICGILNAVITASQCLPQLLNYSIFQVLAGYDKNNNRSSRINKQENNIVTKFVKIMLFHAVSDISKDEKATGKSSASFTNAILNFDICQGYEASLGGSGELKNLIVNLLNNEKKQMVSSLPESEKEKSKYLTKIESSDIYGHIDSGAPLLDADLDPKQLFDALELKDDEIKHIKKLQKKNKEEFKCVGDYNVLTYKMVLYLSILKGDFTSYFMGKIYCDIFKTENPSSTKITNDLLFTLCDFFKESLCFFLPEIMCNAVTEKISEHFTTNNMPPENRLKDIIKTIVELSSELLEIVPIRKFVLTQLLGSQSSELNINFNREIIENHLKLIDAEVEASNSTKTFKKILSREIENGFSRLFEDVYAELTKIFKKKLESQEPESENELESWKNIQRDVYNFASFSEKDMEKYLYGFLIEIEKRLKSIDEQNKSAEGYVSIMNEDNDIIDRIQSLKAKLSSRDPPIDYIELIQLRDDIQNFGTGLPPSPSNTMNLELINQAVKIIDGMKASSQYISEYKKKLIETFNSNNKSSSGIEALFDNLDQSVLKDESGNIIHSLRLYPCPPGEILVVNSFTDTECIKIITEDENIQIKQEEKIHDSRLKNDKLIIAINKLQDINLDDDIFPDIVFELYSFPSKRLNDQEMFAEIQKNVRKLKTDLESLQNSPISKALEIKIKKAQVNIDRLLEKYKYDGNYDNFLKSDASEINIRINRKEEEYGNKRIEIIEKKNQIEEEQDETKKKEFVLELNNLEAELLIIGGDAANFREELVKFKSDDTTKKTDHFVMINKFSKSNYDDNINLMYRKILGKLNDSVTDLNYLFYLFTYKYKNTFENSRKIKLLYSYVKFLESTNPEKYTNLPENIKNNIYDIKVETDDDLFKLIASTILNTEVNPDNHIEDDDLEFIKKILTKNLVGFEKYLRMKKILFSPGQIFDVPFTYQKVGSIIGSDDGAVPTPIGSTDSIEYFKLLYPILYGKTPPEKKAGIDDDVKYRKFREQHHSFIVDIANLQAKGYTFQQSKKDDIITKITISPMTPYFVHEISDKYKEKRIKDLNSEISQIKARYAAEAKEHLRIKNEAIFKNKRNYVEDLSEFKYKEAKIAYDKLMVEKNARKTEIEPHLLPKSELQQEIGIEKGKIEAEWTARDKEIEEKTAEIYARNDKKFNEIIEIGIPIQEERIKDLQSKIEDFTAEIKKIYDTKLDVEKGKIREERQKAKKDYAIKCSKKNIEDRAKQINDARWVGSLDADVKLQQADCDKDKKNNDCMYSEPPLEEEKCIDKGYITDSYILNKFSKLSKKNEEDIKKAISNSQDIKSAREEIKEAYKEIDDLNTESDKYDYLKQKEKIDEGKKIALAASLKIKTELDLLQDKRLTDLNEEYKNIIKAMEEARKKFGELEEKVSKRTNNYYQQVYGCWQLTGTTICSDYDAAIAISVEKRDSEIKPLEEELYSFEEAGFFDKAKKTVQKGINKALNAVLMVFNNDFKGSSLTVDATTNMPPEIYSPTFLLFDENDGYSSSYNMVDFEHYKKIREKNIENPNFEKNIKFEFILLYYKETEIFVQKSGFSLFGGGKKKLFIFKPDIELYEREFEDFKIDEFANAFQNNYNSGNVNFDYKQFFLDKKIKRSGSTNMIKQNDELLSFIPLSIFSKNNVYLYWKLSRDPDGIMLKNYISLKDLDDMKKKDDIKLRGQQYKESREIHH